MRTHWKILLTFGILTLFILVIASLIVFLTTGFGGVSPFGGGYVAVIPLKGEITFGGCGGSLLSGPVACASVEEIKKAIEKANEDSSVGAILLDINSGGGSVVATRELNYAVRGSGKPVVAYIGEVGASGAYYVASAAKRVVSDENSITGSIGVRMEVMQYYDLMGKLGVNVTTIKAGSEKDVGSPYRPMTDEEREDLQHIVDLVYEDFLKTVAENRNLDLEYVRSIADGKIYLGSEAKELRLVDDTGSFEYALNVSALEGGIEGKPRVKNMKTGDSLGGILSGEAYSDVLYNVYKIFSSRWGA